MNNVQVLFPPDSVRPNVLSIVRFPFDIKRKYASRSIFPMTKKRLFEL